MVIKGHINLETWSNGSLRMSKAKASYGNDKLRLKNDICKSANY